MKLTNVGDVIATRALTLRGDDGDKEIVIVIGKPRPFDGGTDFLCPYQIRGMERKKVTYAGGVDAVQALELALAKIGAELYTSEAAKSGKLRWDGGDAGDLGFPVPATLQDLGPRNRR